MLKLFKLTLSIITALTVSSVCYQLTHGFTIANIYPDHYFSYEAPINPQVISVLDQPFFLFNSGYMTYAFKSRDDRYVLKLLKCHHTSLSKWRKLLPNIEFFASWNRRTLELHQKKAFNDYLSMVTAFNEFREESRLITINTSSGQGRFPTKITIYDAQNIPHQIDCNQVPFILQKKVEIFEDAFLKSLHHGSYLQAIHAAKRLIDLIVLRLHKGYADADFFIHKNVGWDDGEPVLLDIGSLIKKDEMSQSFMIDQVELTLQSLKKHLIPYPELLEDLSCYWEEVQATL